MLLLVSVSLAGCGSGTVRTVTATRPAARPTLPASVTEFRPDAERYYRKHYCGSPESASICRCKVHTLRDAKQSEHEFAAFLNGLARGASDAKGTEDGIDGACINESAPQQQTTSPSPPPAQTAQTFSGNGSKNLGTLTVDQPSELRWTNDGPIFQILDADFAIGVNSTGHRGTSALDAATYKRVSVNAEGNWTIKIVPTG